MSIKISFSTGSITILSALSCTELKSKATQTPGKMKPLKEQMLCFRLWKKYSKIASLHKFHNFKKQEGRDSPALSTCIHIAKLFLD